MVWKLRQAELFEWHTGEVTQLRAAGILLAINFFLIARDIMLANVSKVGFWSRRTAGDKGT